MKLLRDTQMIIKDGKQQVTARLLEMKVDELRAAIIQGVYKRMEQFRKLTRNLFLTLHGQNLHRQQRQLSKFLMRYQQFASHAYCGAAEPVSKMASQQENAFCVLHFEVFRSVITVQCSARFRKDAPCTERFFQAVHETHAAL